MKIEDKSRDWHFLVMKFFVLLACLGQLFIVVYGDALTRSTRVTFELCFAVTMLCYAVMLSREKS